MKVEIIETYLRDEKSTTELSREYDIALCTLYFWINKDRSYGIDIFIDKRKNKRYPKEFKARVVQHFHKSRYH